MGKPKSALPALLMTGLLSAVLSASASTANFTPVRFDENDTLEDIRDKIAFNGYDFEVNTNWVFNLSPDEKRAMFVTRTPAKTRSVNDDAGPLTDLMKIKRSLPSSFDWRSHNGHSYIGAVRDQGSCGSCYAFGAAAAAECTYNYAAGLTDADCVDFSESFIIWCLATLPAYSSHFYGCDGADASYAELGALVDEGICYESAFPYVEEPTSCGDHWNDTRVTFDSWHRIGCGDINAIKTAIMTYGAVDAAVYVGNAFYAYSSGIYEDANTACNGNPCYYTPANHAIALVGWNDADGCWILRNSWGSSWGEGGYMRIKYNSAVVSCMAYYLTIYMGPSISTAAADSITDDSANLTGAINPNGNATTYYFEYGETTSYGSTTPIQNAGSGSSTLPVSATISSLNSQNTYHFRLVGECNGRTIPGADASFTTLGEPTAPSTATVGHGNVRYDQATLYGSVNPHSAESWYWFEFGTNNTYEQQTTPKSIGSGTAANSVSAYAKTLAPETLYYYRCAASNAYGITYGTARSFTTPIKPVTFLDEDFENAGKIPTGWTEEYVKPCIKWSFRSGGQMGYPSSAKSGSYNANVFYDSWGARSAYLVSPSIDFGTKDYAKLTFWMYSKEWIDDHDILRVYFRRAPESEWEILASYPQNINQWTQKTLYLTNLSANCNVAFQCLLDYGYGVSIDDVFVESCTPPPPPSSMSIIPNDFDGDHKSDIGCYYPENGNWYIYMSQSGFSTRVLGYVNTEPVTGDFDGDGLCDYGSYLDNMGWWDIMCSKDGYWTTDFGYEKTKPVTGDFNGDKQGDFGCYYPASGYWYIFMSNDDGFWSTTFGYDGTTPITGDFDGDGKTDFGCYYPPAGNWYIFQSSDGFKTAQFGYGGTTPITGDFDGDKKCDFGCYYPPGGNWYIFKSRDGFYQNQFGYAGTTPITGDYDGDGIYDFGCYYAPGGYWYIYKSKEGFWTTQFGYEGTVPLK